MTEKILAKKLFKIYSDKRSSFLKDLRKISLKIKKSKGTKWSNPKMFKMNAYIDGVTQNYAEAIYKVQQNAIFSGYTHLFSKKLSIIPMKQVISNYKHVNEWLSLGLILPITSKEYIKAQININKKIMKKIISRHEFRDYDANKDYYIRNISKTFHNGVRFDWANDCNLLILLNTEINYLNRRYFHSKFERKSNNRDIVGKTVCDAERYRYIPRARLRKMIKRVKKTVK